MYLAMTHIIYIYLYIYILNVDCDVTLSFLNQTFFWCLGGKKCECDK